MREAQNQYRPLYGCSRIIIRVCLYPKTVAINAVTVFERSWGNWAVEVKTGNFTDQDVRGLTEFFRRYPAFVPFVVAAPGDEEIGRRHELRSISWRIF